MPVEDLVTANNEPAGADDAPVVDTPAAENKKDGSRGESLDTRGVLLFYLAIGIAVALWVKRSRDFLFAERWRWEAGLALIALLLAVLVVPYTSRWLQEKGTSVRAGLLFFGLIPALLIGYVAFFVLLPTYEFYALRSLFLIVVILLPGVMFYLFILNRKISLLNQFVANLDRLGLLDTQVRDPSAGCQREFASYMRKFEAMYGTVSDATLKDALLGVSDRSDSRGLTDRVLTAETGVPVVVATLLIALGWLLVLPFKDVPANGPVWFAALSVESSPVNYAFLGAYFFTLQMLFRRYVLRDLRPSAYVSISMRIILSVIGIWVVSAMASISGITGGQGSLYVIGFIIGVFPPIVWQFVQSAFKRIGATFVLPSLRSELPISDLDGLTVWHEARLEEEGIENTPNMATADIVELMVQTRFPAGQIIDWIDQAILYTNMGPEQEPRKKLRVHGIRTATSLQVAYAKTTQGSDQEAFEKILSGGDGARSPIRALVDTLATNPNLELIRNWKYLGHREPGVDSINKAA